MDWIQAQFSCLAAQPARESRDSLESNNTGTGDSRITLQELRDMDTMGTELDADWLSLISSEDEAISSSCKADQDTSDLPEPPAELQLNSEDHDILTAIAIQHHLDFGTLI